jgi:hypothetical protein
MRHIGQYKKFGDEPPDHAIGRSRGGLTTKNHLVCDATAAAGQSTSAATASISTS